MERSGVFWSVLTLGMFAGGSLLVATPAAAGNPDKVEICHFPPGNPANAHTIRVSENAMKAHLKHGDFLGACEQPCEERCDDGNACTRDYCDENLNCESDEAVDCNDGNECTTDSCNPDTGGCMTTPVPAGAHCEYPNPSACTLAKGQCDVAGECAPQFRLGCCELNADCLDDNLCTNETCNQTTNTCETTSTFECDNDACRVGVCIDDTGACEYTDVLCEPSLCQTLVGCDPVEGCMFETDPNCCDPDDPNACYDGQNCTADVCDPVTNLCSNPDCRPNLGECITVVTCNEDCSPFAVEELFCDDGNPCTNDSCVDEAGAWACLNELSNCDDGNLCTVDSCDPLTGDCFSEPLPDIVTGTDVGECQTQVAHCTAGGLYEVIQQGIWPTDEECDGLDNDCDGVADDGLNYRYSGTDTGECRQTVETCSGGSWVIFLPGQGPVPEDCDGLDNDCDGTVLDEAQLWLVPFGSDGGLCEPGYRSCSAGSWRIDAPPVCCPCWDGSTQLEQSYGPEYYVTTPESLEAFWGGMDPIWCPNEPTYPPPTNPDQPPLMHNDCFDEELISPTVGGLITRSGAECGTDDIFSTATATTEVYCHERTSGVTSCYCSIRIPHFDTSSPTGFRTELLVMSDLTDVETDLCMAQHDAFTSRTAFPSSGTGLPSRLGTAEDGGCGLPCPDDSCR